VRRRFAAREQSIFAPQHDWSQRLLRAVVVDLEAPVFGVPSGRNEFGEYVGFMQRTFPDFSGVVEEIISEGDKAFARLTWQGTHSGELFGVAPTRRRIQYAGAAVFKFRGDRIAEVWVLGDIYGLINQLKAN
jgi:predicted ester cyclase